MVAGWHGRADEAGAVVACGRFAASDLPGAHAIRTDATRAPSTSRTTSSTAFCSTITSSTITSSTTSKTTFACKPRDEHSHLRNHWHFEALHSFALPCDFNGPRLTTDTLPTTSDNRYLPNSA